MTTFIRCQAGDSFQIPPKFFLSLSCGGRMSAQALPACPSGRRFLYSIFLPCTILLVMIANGTDNDIKIEPSWKGALKEEFGQDYFKTLREFVKGEYQHAIIYPAPKNIFRAFDLCPFDKVEVVILGQDPYHGPKQANGLCFAVSEGVPLPPSLQNVFKELAADTG